MLEFGRLAALNLLNLVILLLVVLLVVIVLLELVHRHHGHDHGRHADLLVQLYATAVVLILVQEYSSSQLQIVNLEKLVNF